MFVCGANITVSENNVDRNIDGIDVMFSDFANITRNNVTRSQLIGIGLFAGSCDCRYVTISNNNIAQNYTDETESGVGILCSGQY